MSILNVPNPWHMEHSSDVIERLKPLIVAYRQNPSLDLVEVICLHTRQAFTVFLPDFLEFGASWELGNQFYELLDTAVRLISSDPIATNDVIAKRYLQNISRRRDLLAALLRDDRKEFRRLLDTALDEKREEFGEKCNA